MPIGTIAVCGLGRVGTVAARLLHEAGFGETRFTPTVADRSIITACKPA